jgi:drug/metabolite transporter (DMT)-like permease
LNSTTHPDIPIGKVILFLIAGLLSFGAAPILVRFGTDVDPLVLAALRTLMAVIILLPFWYTRRKKLSELKKEGASPLLMMSAGACLGLHFTFWIASLHYTSVASASVLVTIHPVMLIVAESFILKRSFRPLVWIGVFVAFGGSLMLGIADESQQAGLYPNPLLGNIFAFSAAVIFVIYFMLGRKIRQHTEWIDYVFYIYLYAAIVCTVLSFLWVGGVPYISFTALLVGLALAVGPTILGHGSMNYAVKYISPTLLSTLILSEAVLAAIAAYFIFDEVPAIISIVAMLIIIFGVSLTWSRRFTRAAK